MAGLVWTSGLPGWFFELSAGEGLLVQMGDYFSYARLMPRLIILKKELKIDLWNNLKLNV
jgi:hypothetical protein